MHYPKKISLENHVFQKLFDAVIQKLRHKYGLHRETMKNSEFFGMDDFAPAKMPRHKSVAYYIAEDPEVKAFCESLPPADLARVNFGAALYKKEQDLKNQVKVISLQGRAYTGAYFRFLGFHSLEEFELAYSTKRSTEGDAPPAPGDWTYYIGAYYSFVSYRVKKFLLAVNYHAKTEQGLPAWLWGFHNNEVQQSDVSGPVSTIRMSGYAEVLSSQIYIRLKGDPGNSHGHDIGMNIIGLCTARGGYGLSDQEIIMASVQTVSLRYYLVNAEVVLVQTTPEYAELFQREKSEYRSARITPALSTDDNKSLHLYLMLQRKNFWVRYPPFGKLEDLRIKGQLISSYTERLQGVWRIWNFGLQRGKMIQSRLEIGVNTPVERPFASYFYPFIKERVLERYRGQRDPREQVVALSVSNETAPDQLCFATFIKSHLNLANYAIFDLRTIDRLGYAEGMFVSGGYDEHGIIGGYAVMTKETQGREIDVKEMSEPDALREAEALGLESMYYGLRKLWKRKLWKRRRFNFDEEQPIFSD